MNNINIIKANGDKALFQVEKLINSLRRSQANETLIQQIVEQVEAVLYDGMTTKQIYKMAFKMLKGKSSVSASRYKLKKALMELGPTGFPFEKLVGKLMEHEGFATEVGVIVQGNCVQHEIDVIAQKENNHYMIECKYHSDQGRFCNVKIPLYIHSRFLDVEKQWERQKGHEAKLHKGGVYTNTRFTTDAIQYGKCVGLLMTSWDYPYGNGLKDRIDTSGLHPLTALTSITKSEKTKLLDKGIVLCKEIHENPTILDQIGIPKSRHKNILDDSNDLCSNH
ncbi:ATP cone domain-containing protein [uncultured Flavobacterium sp.]|uniref:ATP cone domain-containing protein n=1 Tax=uncultured Flavobacterium sp. TaxID=165435 RepID=UPI0030EF8101|tara:strand:+ start:8914 stop:9753 length:840 start_codon:yes stop_codon:yes gene_type:complete